MMNSSPLCQLNTLTGQLLIEKTVKSVFDAADINSDGELSFEEFISTFVNKHYSLTGFIDSSAARFKRDLTVEEIEELKSLFSFMDENNDGKISADEMAKGLQDQGVSAGDAKIDRSID